MPTARHSLAKIRDSVGTGVKQAIAQTRGRAGDGGTVYARARLKRAEISEKYFVNQEISNNRREEMGEPATGRIELTVPYDGFTYFTRQARDDVARAIAAHPRHGDTAVIGHLVLQDYGKTTLRSSLQLADRHGSVAIEVPIDAQRAGGTGGAGGGGPGGLGHLIADRRTCVTTYDFDPDLPAVFPAKLEIAVFDPDSFDLPSLDLMTGEARQHVAEKIRQQVSFQNHLSLHIAVQLNLPARDGFGGRPKLARMAIGWPTITSLRTLRLRAGNRLAHDGDGVEFSDKPVRYDPVKRCLEWEDIPMFKLRAQGNSDVHTYESPAMLLHIQHPGELYRQETLNARAEVEIPGYLLSGLTARLYDATGHPYQDPQLPKLTTYVSAAAELRLNDAFAKRDFSPYQQLFFDEIIPDEMRITDIVTALKDKGFEIVWPPNDEPQRARLAASANWFLVAQRQKGPDKMELWISVEGRHFETERETTVPGGGVIHKTKLQSGELRVFIRGTFPRDSKELTHEMNTLRRMLQERYDRVRQRR